MAQDLAERIEAEALAQWDAEVERLATEHHAETQAEPARCNRRSTEAMIVRVSHAGLTEAQLVALIGAGWRWSHRRGGMWWTARNEQACRLAAYVCAPRVIDITE